MKQVAPNNTIKIINVSFVTNEYFTHEQEIRTLLNDAYKQKAITSIVDPIQSLRSKIAHQDQLISATQVGIEQRYSFVNQVISTFYLFAHTEESLDEEEMSVQYQARRDILCEELNELKKLASTQIEIHYHPQNEVKAKVLQTKLEALQVHQEEKPSQEESVTPRVKFM